MLTGLGLKTLVTVPYVALVLLITLAISAVSYLGARQAMVDHSGPWLREAAAHISLRVADHLVSTRPDDVSGDAAVSAAPAPAPSSLPPEVFKKLLASVELNSQALVTVVDTRGRVIAAAQVLAPPSPAEGARTHEARSAEDLAAEAFRAMQTRLTATAEPDPQSASFDDVLGRSMQVAYVRLPDSAGLNAWVLVAVARSELLAPAEKSLTQSLWLTLGAAVATALLGMMVHTTLTNELLRVVEATRRLGEGQRMTNLPTQRKDEIGDVARAFTRMQERLYTDRLTGVQNREAVMRSTDERIGHRRRRSDPRPFAVLFADLNGFKQINDRYGHDVGDEVLREVATRMRRSVRAQDMVARYAGDEFVIVLEDTANSADVEVVRSNLEAALHEPLECLRARTTAQEPIRAAATFGVAMYPRDGDNAEILVKRADEDMYRRKPGRPG